MHPRSGVVIPCDQGARNDAGFAVPLLTRASVEVVMRLDWWAQTGMQVLQLWCM